jgi:hypothetical protein
MALSQDEKNQIKEKVLYEMEKMFTGVTEKYNTEQNHDMMLYLLDIEKAAKQSLSDVN